MNKRLRKENADQVPCSLKYTQEWFAGIITNRLGEKDTIQEFSPHGLLIAEEAGRYVVPSPSLRPHERMQIYNQQYWWRLLNTLHLNFPLMTRLFGRHVFNEVIAIPYLMQHTPHDWQLSSVGEKLPKWILDTYHKPDKTLVHHAASLDWAFTASYMAAQAPSLELETLIQDNPDNLLEHIFYLQPHIHLFTWEYDLLKFREAFVAKEADYWMEQRFPELIKGKTYSFILYRNCQNYISWREISQGEFLLLEQFKKGTTLADACEHFETQDNSLYEQVATNMEKWLQEWTHANWLTLNPCH